MLVCLFVSIGAMAALVKTMIFAPRFQQRRIGRTSADDLKTVAEVLGNTSGGNVKLSLFINYIVYMD